MINTMLTVALVVALVVGTPIILLWAVLGGKNNV